MTENLLMPSNDFDQLRRPRSMKMSEQIARQTVDYIIGNGLVPGTRLPVEAELGRTLGVGRNTLREALRLLEAWGVIEIRQGRNGGAIVRHPDPSDLRGPLTVQLLFDGATLDDVLEIRLMLEPETAYLAAQKMSEDEVADLEASVTRLRTGGNASHDAFIQENRYFHSAIARHTGNIVLRSVIESIEAVFDGTAQGVSYSSRRRGAVADAHARIAKAIQLGDPDKAREEMRAHLLEAGSYWTRNRSLMEKRLNWPD